MNKSKPNSPRSPRKRKDYHHNIDNNKNQNNKKEIDKTQWNEHWNDWISRCNQFSSCLNKSFVIFCDQICYMFIFSVQININ